MLLDGLGYYPYKYDRLCRGSLPYLMLRAES